MMRSCEFHPFLMQNIFSNFLNYIFIFKLYPYLDSIWMFTAWNYDYNLYTYIKLYGVHCKFILYNVHDGAGHRVQV